MTTNLDLALLIANRWSIIPCRLTPENKKPPLTEHGFYDATRDIDQIRTWWKAWPGALIGIPAAMNGFFAVDVDDGPSWSRLVVAHGDGQPVAVGPAQLTPRGGGAFHMLFVQPGDIAIRTVAGSLAPGVDLRGNNYICTGITYKWLPGHEFTRPLTMAPAWLLDIFRSWGKSQNKTAPMGAIAPTPPPRDIDRISAYWLTKYLRLASIGNRHKIGFELARQLRDSGLSPEQAEAVEYPERVPQSPSNRYTRRDWIGICKYAFKHPRREPAIIGGKR